MAAIRKRGNRQWRAEVAKKDSRTGLLVRASSTHLTRAEAEAWAQDLERSLRLGTYRSAADKSDPDAMRLRKLIMRYMAEVTPKKKGAKQEMQRLRVWLRHPLADRKADSIEASEWAEYRDQRLETISQRDKPVSPSTVRHELIAVSNVLEHARREWSLPIVNHIRTIKMPPAAKGREMTLTHAQYLALVDGMRRVKGPSYAAAIELARETGLRRGELLRLRWSNIKLKPEGKEILIVSESKNGSGREVPLTLRALAILKDELHRPEVGDCLVFEGVSEDQLTRTTSSVASSEEVNADGFCFHDLRHLACGHLAGKLQLHELAKVLGHKTLLMVMRYYQPRASDMTGKIRAA